MIKPKKSMTSYDVVAVVSEINARIKGSRLHNIYAYENGFLFRFKSAGIDARLIVVPGERLHFTKYDVSEKGMPPPFVMGLRKYLRGAVFEHAEQLGFDRIVRMKFWHRSEAFSVVVELLPRGILALLDAEDTIIQTSSTMKLRDREIRRGSKYVAPPSRSIHPLDLEEAMLSKILGSSECDPVRSIVRELWYPGEAVEEALLRIGIEPGSATCEQLINRTRDIVDAFKQLYRESLEARGYIVLSNEPLTVTPFKPIGLQQGYGFSVREFGSLSEALDEYFIEAVRGEEENKRAALIAAERAKLLASMEQAKRNLSQLFEKVSVLEKRAQMIAENIQLVYEALECANRVRRQSGWDYIAGNCPGVVDVKPSEGKIVLSIGGELVDIDIRKDPSQLIVDLYKRIGELRAKIERGTKALRELEEKLRNLEKEQEKVKTRARARIRRREWYEKYHWLVTSHGYLAIGGRDADQNESIVKRYLTSKRIFMHADIHGAPAVVLFNEGEEPPETDLREAALLTAAYSKAWKTGIGSVDVYWVWGSQVSKSPPPGEYITKGAFMVYGKRNYIRGIELRLAIGIGVENEAPIVIVGPEELVRRRSVVYAVLIPGDEDPSLLAKRIKRLTHSRAADSYAEIISALSVEDIREKIPGRSRLLGLQRGDAVEHPRPIKHIYGEEA